MNKIIEVVNLCKKYYSKDGEMLVLDNVNFELLDGEFLVIVGPSGCGKSTLLNILGKIDFKTSGEIFNYYDKKIGYMLQTDSLFPWLTILDNALLGLKIGHKLTLENINYVKELLNTYGLGKDINKYPRSLSGGMRQRVALIRTLALKPDILLLDEPFSALDYQTRQMVSDDVYRIIKKEGKSVIMITHDIGEAVSIGDRVLVMSASPSKVKKIFTIKLTDKDGPINNRKAPEFGYYYDMIWKAIDKHAKSGI